MTKPAESMLSSILESVVTNLFAHPPAAPGKGKLEWGLTGCAVFLAAMGLIFLNIAVYNSLSERTGMPLAALGTAAAVFAEALLALALRYLFRRPAPRQDAAHKPQGYEDLYFALRDACEDLEGPVRENPKTAVALAALAGMMLARRM